MVFVSRNVLKLGWRSKELSGYETSEPLCVRVWIFTKGFPLQTIGLFQGNVTRKAHVFLTGCQLVLNKQPRVRFGWDPCLDVSGNQAKSTCSWSCPELFAAGAKGSGTPWSTQVCRQQRVTAGCPCAAQTWLLSLLSLSQLSL